MEEGFIMLDNKENVLNGKNNARMNTTEPMDDVSTEAWTSTEKVYDRTNVNIPSAKAVNDAKRWVDNGSKL